MAGSPVVIIPSGLRDIDSGNNSLKYANDTLYRAVGWAAPLGLVESGALKNDENIILASPNPIAGMELEGKIIASGTSDWNVYTSAAAASTAVAQIKPKF